MSLLAAFIRFDSWTFYAAPNIRIRLDPAPVKINGNFFHLL